MSSISSSPFDYAAQAKPEQADGSRKSRAAGRDNVRLTAQDDKCSISPNYATRQNDSIHPLAQTRTLKSKATKGFYCTSLGRIFKRAVAWVRWKLLGTPQTITIDFDPQRFVFNQVAAVMRHPLEFGITEEFCPEQGDVFVSLSRVDRGPVLPVSDTTIVELLGYAQNSRDAEEVAYRCEQDGDSLLFEQGAPKLGDIQQSACRQNSAFLSTIATILARPDGPARIQSMMFDHGDGTVTVRFNDVDIRVRKDRLLNHDGTDVLSPGAPWVRILEKAYLGYLKYQFDQTQVRNNRRTVAAFREPQINRGFQFDGNSATVAQAAFAHVLQSRSPRLGRAYPVVPQRCQSVNTIRANCGNHPVSVTPELRSAQADQAFAFVSDHLKMGGAVVARSASWTPEIDKTRPNHTYAVLGVVEQESEDPSQQDIRGYWMFDPQRQGLTGFPELASVPEEHLGSTATVKGVDAVPGHSPLFFISDQDAALLFSEFRGFEPLHRDRQF